MTIAAVRAISLRQAENYAPGVSAIGTWHPRDANVAFVGFTPKGPSPFDGRSNALVVDMDDVEADEIDALPESQKREALLAWPVPPSIAIARCIVKHIGRYARHSDPWWIIVHCTAGISRSGAVAMWVHEYYAPHAQTTDAFVEMHMHCLPNQSLLRLLREASKS